MGRVEGKVAFISGAARGQGRTLARFGVYRAGSTTDPMLLTEIEKLGFSTVWLTGCTAGLTEIEHLLDGTERITVATGILNMWDCPAATVAASYHRVTARHPGRFVLGLGVGHREVIARFQRPFEKAVDYVDHLDAAGVPASERVLAALGPRMLRLAGQRSAGAFSYLVTPEHTASARELLGPGPLLIPEHKVALGSDPSLTRGLARAEGLRSYLDMGLSNYLNSFRRLGFSDEDFTNGGSDRLVDALVAQGDPATAATRLRAHLDAGADQVAIQLITAPGADPLPGYRQLAQVLC